jgi:TolA-binding protein
MDATTPEAAAWQRALRMRVTQDWKMLETPAAATHLEKLEYFRARRATLRRTRAGQDLTNLGEPVAVDFARIAAGRSLGVEDGNDFIDGGIASEIAELAYVYKQMHQRELPAALPADVINARASGLLADGDPQVLPWGAWAEFGNRHIGMWAIKLDYHYRHMQGAADSADDQKRELDARLGHLTMYPVASTGRTKGQRGTEADLSQIDEAIDVAVAAPELVTYDYWTFIENGTNYEPVKRGMPKRATWFAPPSAEVPYDIALRAEGTLGSLKPPAIEALMDEAPHNIGLLSRVAQRFKTNEQLTSKVRELTGPRVAYDMWAIDAAINTARDADDRIALRRHACELAVSQCLELASELARQDDAAAAAEYEKAFANPALDAVAMTWSSRWLVQYYERTNQSAKATQLAERSAAVGSAPGMFTLALLHERRSEFDQAEQLYTAVASRYPDGTAPLAAFLYRQAVEAKKPEYADRWKAIAREVFPGGIQPVATEMKTRPANGVFVEKDSFWSRKAGLQAGDIIVGIDGLKVQNLEQLDAVLWFKPQARTYQFTAWRGVLLTAEIPTRHDMTLKTHPLKGWIE